MKWMIASDIHGSAYYCRKLLEAYTEEGPTGCFYWGIFYTTAPEMICQRLCA